MNVKDMRRRKIALEADLSQLVRSFEEETGVSARVIVTAEIKL